MKSMYLIRHGEVYNPDNIYYSRLPGYGLSENGQEQLNQTGIFLQDKHIDTIYTSPMLRARQSAEILQRMLAVPLNISEELIEVNTSYQGRPFTDFDEIQSEIYLKPLAETDENVEQIARRMYDFFQTTVNAHIDKATVFVSHGDPLMALSAKLRGNKLDFQAVRNKPYISHGEVWEITQVQGNYQVKYVFKPEVS